MSEIVKVIDRPCGTGKSTDLIDEINSNNDKYLVIVPVLTEVSRFRKECPRLKEPEGNGGLSTDSRETKLSSVIVLLENNESIVTTHALYKQIKLIQHLLGDYHIVIDEVLNVVEELKYSLDFNDTWSLISEKRLVIVRDNNLVEVSADEDELSGYEEKGNLIKFVRKAQEMEVFYIDGTHYVVQAPHELFTSGKSCRVLTFLFKGSKLQGYFDAVNINYNIKVDAEILCNWKKEARNNLTIIPTKNHYQCNVVAISGGSNSSANAKAKLNRQQIAQSIKNLWNTGSLKSHHVNEVLVCAGKAAWDKDNEVNQFSPKDTLKHNTGLASADWVPVITRGTNEYSDKTVMFYLHKAGMSVNVKNHLGLSSKKDKELLIVSEAIQVIYRLAIRNNKPVVVVIPDKDVARLIKKFIEN